MIKISRKVFPRTREKVRLWRWRNSTSFDEAKVLRYLINYYNMEEFIGVHYYIRVPEKSDRDGHPPVFYDEDGLMKLKTIGSMHIIMHKLVSDGYLIEYDDDNVTYGGDRAAMYELTDKGKYFFANRRKERLSVLLKSVLVPIIVTIIVNLLRGS